MLLPTASGLGAGLGVQVTVLPAGKPVTLHVGAAAGLGPLLVQVTVPLTVEPAGGLLGIPEIDTCMSACGVMVRGSVSVLLLATGSVVLVPAVVVIFNVPLAGAAKVELQVMPAPTASGSGTGVGVQLCVAPAGSPLNAQAGAAAGLGPLLVQVPLTVML